MLGWPGLGAKCGVTSIFVGLVLALMIAGFDIKSDIFMVPAVVLLFGGLIVGLGSVVAMLWTL